MKPVDKEEDVKSDKFKVCMKHVMGKADLSHASLANSNKIPR